VVWPLEKVCDGEVEELAMILAVKEEEGASRLAEVLHMEQQLVLEEVEICICMGEKLAPP